MITMADFVERIAAMLKQESTSYLTRDYLAVSYQQQIANKAEDHATPAELLSASEPVSTSCINELWREKICEWSYQVVDHFEFSREVVSVSMNYLDRFLATRTVNKKVFQLAAMTSLFIAIKIFETGKIGMSSMIELSRGYFSVEQMAAMEMTILRSLEWKVHPPTAYTFVVNILSALPIPFLSVKARRDVLELSRFLTELSVIDYFFVSYKASDVALASLIHALELMSGSAELIELVLQEAAAYTDLDISRHEVMECRNRLYLLYAQGGYAQETELQRIEAPRFDNHSPVCVSYGISSSDMLLQRSMYYTAGNNMNNTSSCPDIAQ